MSYKCPGCTGEMKAQKIGEGMGWTCLKCGGRAVNLAVTKTVTGTTETQRFWVEAMHNATESDRVCPLCTKKMKKYKSEEQLNSLELDVCLICYFIYFDRGEFEALPPPKPTAAKPLDPYTEEYLKKNPLTPTPPSTASGISQFLNQPIRYRSRFLERTLAHALLDFLFGRGRY